jgi:hypothetical protein
LAIVRLNIFVPDEETHLIHEVANMLCRSVRIGGLRKEFDEIGYSPGTEYGTTIEDTGSLPPSSKIIPDNEASDLYFVDPETSRVIFLPKNWVNEFVEHDEDTGERETYCWYGNDDTLAYQGRDGQEMLTTDSQAWFKLKNLDEMRRVSYNEARAIDSELFTLLDDYDAKRCV